MLLFNFTNTSKQIILVNQAYPKENIYIGVHLFSNKITGPFYTYFAPINKGHELTLSLMVRRLLILSHLQQTTFENIVANEEIAHDE